MEVFIMKKEYLLEVIGWAITIGLLIKFIPKNKIRHAQVAYGFKLFITWLVGLSVVELGLIEYPIRLFPNATKTSFSFEYFIYPSFCAVFNVNFPEKKGAFGQFMYYFYYCTSLTIIEVIVERYTNILNYIHWTWYTTWITLFITFYMSRKFCVWFFKIHEKN
jgi:hypothetical protein